MKKNKDASFDLPSGVLPYCKKSGLTSFSSLSVIKKSLGTSKVGHTGTLDSFADGLLIVLCGNLTHLVEHVTSFTKTYLALVCFGKETDTLDPTGQTLKALPPPSKGDVEEALPKFTGPLLQTPPAYSALHVDGKRASDLVRSGQEVHLEPRQIFVYKNTLIDFLEPSESDPCAYALLEISCSKGTYIRSLARDIASSLKSCAHLVALRRTQVGPFKIEESAFYKDIKPLTIQNALQDLKNMQVQDFGAKKEKKPVSEQEIKEVRSHFLAFTPSLAQKCSLSPLLLKNEFERYFMNGRPLKKSMLLPFAGNDSSAQGDAEEAAVFYADNSLAGVVSLPSKKSDKYSYGFVVQKKKKEFRTFSWQDIILHKFPLEWLCKGTALSVGSFDGVHKGHKAILERLLAKDDFVRGCVTFTSPAKTDPSFSGELSSVEQKKQIFSDMGLDFAIVIDFSPEFSKIEGTSFIHTLFDECGMRFIAEGQDFCCGYKGAFKMNDLASLCRSEGIECALVQDVLLEGSRISSSRIRDAVQKADFDLALRMTGRPFAYDCTGLEWKEENGSFWASAFSRQVLPVDGKYGVTVELTAAAEDSVELNAAALTTLHAECAVAKGRISLSMPSANFASRVKKIIF